MKKVVASIVLALLGAGILANYVVSNNSASNDCITVYVDYSGYGNNKPAECLTIANSEVDAITLLETAGYSLSGTDKYGDQIVCRVNNVPSATQQIQPEGKKAFVEQCLDMPSADAYWSIMIKTHEKDWSWSENGIAETHLHPGDKLALVFTINEQLDIDKLP